MAIKKDKDKDIIETIITTSQNNKVEYKLPDYIIDLEEGPKYSKSTSVNTRFKRIKFFILINIILTS
jgi:hypothetical protein